MGWFKDGAYVSSREGMSKEDPGKEDAAIVARAQELKSSGAGQRYEDVKAPVKHIAREKEEREAGS